MRHGLLAIDLDATLLDRSGRVSAENAAAVAAAQRAGVRVVPCTGRAWREARRPLGAIPGVEDGVFVTGAAVCHASTGEALDLAVIEPHLAGRLVDALGEEPEAALVLRDPSLAGHDYLVTGEGALSPATQWWFKENAARVRFQRRVEAEDLHHTLRVGMVGPPDRAAATERAVADAFGEEVLLHRFAAVEDADVKRSAHVLEIFAAGVDKWRGLEWLARARSIPSERIAAIGDGLNDLAMISGAGCGIAMANAAPALQERADHVTADCDEHGVAHAIERLLSGRWG